MAEIIQFPGIVETYGTIVELDDAVQAYMRALEQTDLTSKLQVERLVAPIYEHVVALSQLARAEIRIRWGCVTAFKYEHERQQRMKAAGNIIPIGILETRIEEETPHDHPPAKRVA